MSDRNFPDFAGGPVDRSEWERIAEGARRPRHPDFADGCDGAADSGAGGIGVWQATRPSLWGRITAVGPVAADGAVYYSWEQEDKGLDARPTEEMDAPMSGLHDGDDPAQEVNDRDDVPEGAVVRLWRSGAFWLFAYGDSPSLSGSGPDCPAVYRTERKYECEEGELHLYERLVKETNEGGCVEIEEGEWNDVGTEGCCDCGESGSGPDVGGSDPDPDDGCVPGACPHCLEPPASYEVLANGFTGVCEVFNRKWKLLPAASCVWRASSASGLIDVTVTLTVLSASSVQVVFQYGPAGSGISTTVTYAGSMQSGSCCNPVTLSLDGSCPCSGGGVRREGGTCFRCAGPLADSYDFTVAGATGCFAPLNGSYSLPFDEGLCAYYASAGGTEAFFYFVGGQWRLALNREAGFSAIYTFTPPQPGGSGAKPCCDRFTLVLTQSDCATPGNLPASLVLTPPCTSTGGGGGGRCQPRVVAVPECCAGGNGGGGGGSGGDPVGTECCDDPLPATLHASTFDPGTLDPLGDFDLVYDAEDECWRGTGEVDNPTCGPGEYTIEIACRLNEGLGEPYEMQIRAACGGAFGSWFNFASPTFCETLEVTFNDFSIGAGCDPPCGAVNVVITEAM